MGRIVACLFLISILLMGCSLKIQEGELTQLFAEKALEFDENFIYEGNKKENVSRDGILNVLGDENRYYAYNIDTYSYTYNSKFQYKVKVDYMMTKPEMQKAVVKAQQLATILDGGTEYEKVKRVHDYLIDNIEYSGIYSGPYCGFFKGETNCTGYALCFLYIMDEMNIPCKYITDDEHAWNAVCIDGVWFNIDLTYDDTSTGRYDYFLKSDKDWEEHSRGDATALFSFNGDDSDLKITSVSDYNNKLIWMRNGLFILIGLVLVVAMVVHYKKIQKTEK